ncbi:MAG: phage tail protein [Hyphomonadaceae bacterium]
MLGLLPSVASAQVAQSRVAPVSFYFRVNFVDAPDADALAFQEVSGMSAHAGEPVGEGGENRFVHSTPQRPKYENLILRRGVTSLDSPFVKWCQATLEGNPDGPIAPRDVRVSLKDAEGSAMKVWQFSSAWPVKWQVSSLADDGDEIAIEAVELAYAHYRREV